MLSRRADAFRPLSRRKPFSIYRAILLLLLFNYQFWRQIFLDLIILFSFSFGFSFPSVLEIFYAIHLFCFHFEFDTVVHVWYISIPHQFDFVFSASLEFLEGYISLPILRDLYIISIQRKVGKRNCGTTYFAPALLISFPPFFQNNKMAAGHSSDQSLVDSEHICEEDDYQYQTILSPKEKRRNKRKRQTSPLIEIISHSDRNSSDDSDIPELPFQTPMKQNETPKAPPPDLKILIAPIDRSKNFKTTSPLTILKSIQKASGSEPAHIKQYNSGILITCKHLKQHRSLKEIQTIGNIHVKVVEKEKGVKGVIHGVPLEMSESELLAELKNQQVTSAKRMLKKGTAKEKSPNEPQNKDHANSTPERTPMKTVVLTFSKSSLPPQVQLCFQVFKVKQYIPPPIRCFKCQRFGHPATGCRHKERCVRCGDSHSFDRCPQKVTLKCINCGGPHSAAYGGYETAKAATEAQRIKIRKKYDFCAGSTD